MPLTTLHKQGFYIVQIAVQKVFGIDHSVPGAYFRFNSSTPRSPLRAWGLYICYLSITPFYLDSSFRAGFREETSLDSHKTRTLRLHVRDSIGKGFVVRQAYLL